MWIVTSQEMKQIEARAVEYGHSYEGMMENAGAAAASYIRQTLGVENRRCVCICGSGNNGGDGFVVARRLLHKGAQVAVILASGAPKTGQAQAMLEQVRALDIPVLPWEEQNQETLATLQAAEILVDAIYGTGFHGALPPLVGALCRQINDCRGKVVALDIPSGVHGDSGMADSDSVRADYTIAFDSCKPAHIMKGAVPYCGEVVLADIGVDPRAREGLGINLRSTDNNLLVDHLKPKAITSHKGSNGKLLNVSGCLRYCGAAILSTTAALRSGVGYITLATPRSICAQLACTIVEATLLPVEENAAGQMALSAKDTIYSRLRWVDAVSIGSGLGRGNETFQLVQDLVRRSTKPMVIDADGINAVAQDINILKEAKAPIILTPHLGEMARLTGETIEALQSAPFQSARDFAREYGVVLLLKGPDTVIASPTGEMLVNQTGNPGLAKAGSGDVLTGIIASLLAQGISPFYSAACGAYLHGAAADAAAEELSCYAMQPTDVIRHLSQVFLSLGL